MTFCFRNRSCFVIKSFLPDIDTTHKQATMLSEAEIAQLPILHREKTFQADSDYLSMYVFNGVAQHCGRCDIYVKGDIGETALVNLNDSNGRQWAVGKTVRCAPDSLWYKLCFAENDLIMPTQAEWMALGTQTSEQIWPEIRFQKKYELDILDDGVQCVGIVMRLKRSLYELLQFQLYAGKLKLVDIEIISCLYSHEVLDETVFQTTDDQVLTALCMDEYKLLIVLQSHWRRRKAVIEVDLLRAKPEELFHVEYGQLRQQILQDRDKRARAIDGQFSNLKY